MQFGKCYCDLNDVISINPGQLLVGFTQKTVELCLKRHRGVCQSARVRAVRGPSRCKVWYQEGHWFSGNGEIFGVATIWGI